jgi:hypothetical protein
LERSQSKSSPDIAFIKKKSIQSNLEFQKSIKPLPKNISNTNFFEKSADVNDLAGEIQKLHDSVREDIE